MRNKYWDHLPAGYLFAPAQERLNPHFQPLHLGVGDTTLPLSPCVVEALIKHAPLAVRYGPELGEKALRERLAEVFYPMRSADEIFISDGAKTDIGRLQTLFHEGVTVAIQNPTYPSYKETSFLSGKKVVFIPSNPLNFDLQLPQADIYFICSPNNPTGQALTAQQMTHLICHAQTTGSLIIHDAAYASFIKDPSLPKTFYELPGSENCVIEIHSFSKMAGFTGLRLSWTIVPKTLRFRCGHSLHQDWTRLVYAYFNGASRLIQKAGLAALSSEGLESISEQMRIYHKRALELKKGLSPYFKNIQGGESAPYLWIQTSTQPFDDLGIVSLPGEGFGSEGQGYCRLSAFADDSTLREALSRCSSYLKPL